MSGRLHVLLDSLRAWPAEENERCLWCLNKMDAAASLRTLLFGNDKFCPDCQNKLKPVSRRRRRQKQAKKTVCRLFEANEEADALLFRLIQGQDYEILEALKECGQEWIAGLRRRPLVFCDPLFVMHPAFEQELRKRWKLPSNRIIRRFSRFVRRPARGTYEAFYFKEAPHMERQDCFLDPRCQKVWIFLSLAQAESEKGWKGLKNFR